MKEHYQIDSTDVAIIQLLQQNARKPYLEIARKLGVSGGTIHQRVEKLKEAGILIGSKVIVNRERLGLGVTALLGIHVNNAKDINNVIINIRGLPEVLEAFYTTGSFALFIKVVTKDISSFHEFLVNKIQSMKEIRSTESFICLDEPIKADNHMITPDLMSLKVT